MNKFRSGFTIVELLIVITIMAGFIAIGSFGFIMLKEAAEIQRYENNGRNLVSALDESYLSGLAPNGEPFIKSSYPPIAPRGSVEYDINTFITTYYDYDNFSDEQLGGIYGAEQPDPDNPDQFYIENDMLDALYYWKAVIYQPLTKDNELCKYSNDSWETKVCTKFNLFFVKKDTNGTYVYSKIMSKYR